MKIAMPVETDSGLSAPVYGHFGSAPCFLLYDTETRSVEIIDNGDQHHEHGMCQPFSQIADKEVSAVVCGGMGMRAIQKLNENGVTVYRFLKGTAEEALAAIENGTIEELSPADACQGHSGCD